MMHFVSFSWILRVDYFSIKKHSDFHIDFVCRVDYVEMQRHAEFDIDSDGTVSVEEARVSVKRGQV